MTPSVCQIALSCGRALEAIRPSFRLRPIAPLLVALRVEGVARRPRSQALCDDRIFAIIAPMDREGICAQVADILVPVADFELEINRDHEALDSDEALRAEKRRWLLSLREDWGAAGDPVLVALDRTAAKIEELQGVVYELIAYARELAPEGHKYTFDELAAAARMSKSGVRSCYAVGDVSAAATKLALGAGKRGDDQDPRWRGAQVWRWQCSSRAMQDALMQLVSDGIAQEGLCVELKQHDPDHVMVQSYGDPARGYLLPHDAWRDLLTVELSRRPGLGGTPRRRPRRKSLNDLIDQPPF